MTKLEDIVIIQKGRKAPEVFHSPTDGSLPYLQIEDLRPGANPKFACDEKGVVANDDDVIIVWDGANSGTVGFGLSGYIGSTLAVLRFDNSEIFGPFIGYFLKSQFEVIQANTTGATIPHIDRRYLETIEIELPEFSEQKRIAAILAKADRLRHLHRYALELSEGFLQSVFLQMFGDLNKNPQDLKIVNLGSISEIPTGITKGRNLAGKKTVFVPYLRVANVQDGYLDLSEIKQIEALPKDVEMLRLKPGDVLMTEGGDFDKLGRGAVWAGQVDPCIHQNHVFRVRLDKNQVLPKYFAQVLLTPYAKDYFLKASKQTTNLATINKTQLRGFPTPVPTMKKQLEFIEQVKQHERLQAQQREAIRQADHLFDTLLHRAFCGEL